jgi:hypothetical protein
MIRIRSVSITGVKDSAQPFWRCGIRHYPEWAMYPDDFFTAEQLAVLQAEPRLQVQMVEKPKMTVTEPGLDNPAEDPRSVDPEVSKGGTPKPAGRAKKER